MQIAMEVPDVRTFTLQNVRFNEGILRFWWQAGVQFECAVERQDDGSYQGGCRDRWGGRGPLMMIPPGVDVEAIDVNAETLFADWEPPPEKERKTLAERYAEEEVPVGAAVDIGGYRLNVLVMGEGDVTVVLTAMRPVEQPRYIGETEKGLQVKFELHKAWADQAEHATHRVTKTSGPYVHREEPELVIQAIREVVEAATADGRR